MTTGKELEVQQKQEVARAEEATRAARYFVPVSDIHETEDALVVTMEMPGVAKDGVEVTLERNVLKVTGEIDFSTYGDLEPLYTEYALGHFTRSFSLASTIDQEGISAAVNGGVLRLTLPKSKAATPRRVQVH